MYNSKGLTVVLLRYTSSCFCPPWKCIQEPTLTTTEDSSNVKNNLTISVYSHGRGSDISRDIEIRDPKVLHTQSSIET